MTTDKVENLLIKFIDEISALNVNMKSALEKLSNHENRLKDLEDNKLSLKDQTIGWLVKALICSISVIASLTGASTLIMKIFGS